MLSEWIDWNAVTAVATVSLIGVAWFQAEALRKEQAKQRTIQACMIYDLDPIITGYTSKLRAAHNTGDILTKTSEYRQEIIGLLNFLDTLAISVLQDLMIEKIVLDHMKPMIDKHCAEYIDSKLIEKFDINVSNYKCLTDLRTRWSTTGPTYRSGLLN